MKMRWVGTGLVVATLLGAVAADAKDPTQIVTEAYQDILGRKPDEEGLRVYRSRIIDKGWSEEDVRKTLRRSDEYITKSIRQAYKDVLGRDADEGGLATYRKKMKDDGWGIDRVREELRKSKEAKSKS